MGNADFMTKDDGYVDDDDVPLPGFRFHPTDEELVSFYLRRKLDNKPFSVELIKQIDIYKYDPWDLPKASITSGEKEWYFFCKRGRKYRNSIRPNRVTGSGFWKATGIDKPVYSHGGEGNDCIGLKKTLVYYRGSAGKGTKSNWMMHEFRLPATNNATITNLANSKNNAPSAQEAEIWTLCRIFQRNVTKKYPPDWRSQSNAKRHSNEKSNTIMSSVESNSTTNQESYINFGASTLGDYHDTEHKHVINYTSSDIQRNYHQFLHEGYHQLGSPVLAQQPYSLTAPTSSSSSYWINPAANDFFAFENWDELGSVVKFSQDSSSM